VIEYLLDGGASINALTNVSILTLLCLCARLCDAAADVGDLSHLIVVWPTQNGRTALAVAAAARQPHAVSLLLQRGANRRMTDEVRACRPAQQQSASLTLCVSLFRAD
jgi:ankyrin repeat protein